MALNHLPEVDKDEDVATMDDIEDKEEAEDMITDKTDDVRVIVSLDGSKGDVDLGNR